ncbi:MAG: single-stranded DNA-binding protein [bacterium]|jgi:single-strand DNA-binding protein
MLNKVILIGRLVQDPELRYTASGVPVASLRLAVDRPFTNRQGERGTDFINIVAWRRLAEICSQNLGKGRLIAISGRLQVRSFDTAEGQRRWITEVVADEVRFLDRPRQQQGRTEEGKGFDSTDFGPPGFDNDLGADDFAGTDLGGELDFNEDDLPFS